MKKLYLNTFLILFAINSKTIEFNKYKEFREQKIFTDVVLNSNDNIEYHAHRVILAAFSSYFEKMFNSGFKESNNIIVEIPYSSKALNIILDFIYDSQKVRLNNYLISSEHYFELLDFAEMSFSNNLKEALKIVNVDIDQEKLNETIKTVIALKDEILLDKIFSHLKFKHKAISTQLVLFNNLKGGGVMNSTYFNNDGKRIVTAYHYGNAKVWDAFTGEELFTLNHKDFLHFASFIKNGTRIITGNSEKIVKIWDAFTGQELLILKGHNSNVNFAAFNNDDTRIITCDGEGIVKLWDVFNGQALFTFKGPGCVSSVSFTNDSTHIVIVYHDGAAKIWDALTYQELLTLQCEIRDVRCSSSSYDGSRIITSCNDGGTVQVWFLPPKEFYSNNILLTSKDPHSWILLKYYLISYLGTLKEDEKLSYTDFISQREKEITALIEKLSQMNNLLLNYLQKLFDLPS